MVRRWLLVVTLGLTGFGAACEESASPAADARVADAGPPDAGVPDASPPDAAPLPGHCDNVFYWCEAGQVYMGRPRWPSCATQGGGCAQDDPAWLSVQLVGTCTSGCGTPPSGSCGLACETSNGTIGCYAEDATARLCAAAP